MARNGAKSEDHSSWRWDLVERFASALDAERFGVVAVYLLGSTKNGDAGPESDIDIILHVRATDEQRQALKTYISRWDDHARETYHDRTGMHSRSVELDAHLITDEDFRRRTSFAVKIDAVTDGARLIRQYEAEPELDFAGSGLQRRQVPR
jgi:predicted nucleotidyltransferase